MTKTNTKVNKGSVRIIKKIKTIILIVLIFTVGVLLYNDIIDDNTYYTEEEVNELLREHYLNLRDDILENKEYNDELMDYIDMLNQRLNELE